MDDHRRYGHIAQAVLVFSRLDKNAGLK